jgi:hypothetical protein
MAPSFRERLALHQQPQTAILEGMDTIDFFRSIYFVPNPNPPNRQLKEE